MTGLTTPTIIIAWGIASGAALLVFLHADKRGSKHATAWGIGVFLALAFVLPVYVFHSWRRKPSGPTRRY
jgi:ABC-type Co2+ transport system permease subunit